MVVQLGNCVAQCHRFFPAEPLPGREGLGESKPDHSHRELLEWLSGAKGMDCSFLLLCTHGPQSPSLAMTLPFLLKKDPEGLFWSNDNPAGTTPVAKYFQAHA